MKQYSSTKWSALFIENHVAYSAYRDDCLELLYRAIEPNLK